MIIVSLLVRSSPECGILFSLNPLCGQEAGGAPIPFLGGQIFVMGALINWLFWVIPFALMSAVLSLLWRWPRLQTLTVAWITESVILSPALMWSLAYVWASAQLLPSIPWAGMVLGLPEQVASNVSPGYLLASMTDRPLYVVFSAYILIVLFVTSWWWVALRSTNVRSRNSLFFFSTLVIALPFLLNQTDWYAAKFIKPDEYPFQVLSLEQNPQNQSVTFELKFISLPTENETYEISYWAAVDLRPGSTSIGTGDHVDYMRFIGHTLYKYKHVEGLTRFQGPYEPDSIVRGYIVWDNEYQPVRYFFVVVNNANDPPDSTPDAKFYVVPIP